MIEDDINTDQIAPVQMMRALKPDFRELLFLRQRKGTDGSETVSFVLNRPPYRNGGAILVAGRNFGCGSSREAAVWCLQAWGIRCVVARSIADIYRENCLQNGLLPIELSDDLAAAFEARVVAADGAAAFTADLVTQTLSGPGGSAIPFEIGASDKMRLIEGLDDIGFTLKHAGEIAAYEARARDAAPWQQTARDRRGTSA
jgi:3-isopropylmalate dehydratase small subunit